MVSKKLQQLRSGQLTATMNVQQCVKVIEEKNPLLHAFLHVYADDALKTAALVDAKLKGKKAGKLAGLVIGVKSIINVKGMITNCGSKTLANYVAPYDADVIARIKAEDGVIIGMLNCDEFACGGTGTHSAFTQPKNPLALDRVAGGSSSGSAVAIASGMCDITLGTDTGGSIRNPASNCGVVGIKPSYGRVSRYGVIDLAMSLDQVGPLAKDVYGCALMMEVISGQSPSDAMTYDVAVKEYTTSALPQKMRVGISAELMNLCSNKEIVRRVEEQAKAFAKAHRTSVVQVPLTHVRLAVQAYYPLVYTEFYSGTRKLDGRKYGFKIEDTCGNEVLRRITGGKIISHAEHHGLYYRKALMAKEIIKKEFEGAFENVDVLFLPTTPDIPPKIGEILDPATEYAIDALTIPANLAEICAGVVPIGTVNGVPVGMQIFCKALNEEMLCAVMREVEKMV